MVMGKVSLLLSYFFCGHVAIHYLNIRPRRAENVNGSVHVHVYFCFINCLYLIQYIGLTRHKRKSPSTSFGMSRQILSCGKGNRKGGYKYFATNSVGERISMVEVSAAL